MSTCMYFIVPCYNDADTLPVSVPVFLKKLDTLLAAGMISEKSRLLLINDASLDDTWNTILELKKIDSRISAANLEKNAGEQNALLAGMFLAAEKADCVITMDSDLQDDINAVDEMIHYFLEGYEIVYGVRNTRKEDSLLDRISAKMFYKLMRIAGTGLIYQHANFRLMSKKAIALLREYKTVNYYLPCLVSNLGLKSTVVYHKRFKRAAGKTGYNFGKKMHLATDAIFSHSVFPIKLLSIFAGLCGLLTLASIVYLFIKWQNSGVFSVNLCILITILFIGTLLLCALRILGEYIVKIFSELRQAPQFQITEYRQ